MRSAGDKRGLSAEPWPSSALSAGTLRAPVNPPLEASAPSWTSPPTRNHFCDSLKWGGGGPAKQHEHFCAVRGQGGDRPIRTERKNAQKDLAQPSACLVLRLCSLPYVLS